MKRYIAKINNNIVIWVVFVFVVWRVVIGTTGFVAPKIIALNPTFLGPSIWANFDGYHYLKIAEKGYGTYQQAFFPLFPYLIRWLSPIFLGNYLFSGLMISHLALLGFLLFFYKLIRLDFNDKIAKRALYYLIIFPTSLFLVSIYSESLSLLLVIGSFYAARCKRWWVAGILGCFASATRLVGIFLLPALFIEWLSVKGNKNNLKSIFPLLLIPCGLVFYMLYLNNTMNDPLYFIHVQPMFGAQRSGDKLILLYQVFWRYFKMILTTKMDILYFSVWTELLSSLLFLILIFCSYFRLRLSYFVFMISAYLAPTFSGTFSSMPRYVLTLFPGFIILAMLAEKYRWIKVAYPIIAGVLLIISTMLFTRGYWIA